MKAKAIFSSEDHVAPLGLLVTAGAQELGEKVNAHLVNWSKETSKECDSFIIESDCPRFSSGDAKGLI